MIGHESRFGRSEKQRLRRIVDSSADNLVCMNRQGCLFYLVISIIILSFCVISSPAYAIGSSGLFLTKFKIEHQYSDYDRYGYKLISPEYPQTGYAYLNPYITDFPEQRTLMRVTQSLGTGTALQIRYEHSDMSDDKNQYRYYTRFDHNVTDMTTLYGAFQRLDTKNDNPDSSSASGGNMFSLGWKYDMSGWIKAEASLSYDRNEGADGLITNTMLPMTMLRWSIDPVTALTVRWDGYFAENDSGSFPSYAFTGFVSRYLPTQTALHLFCRYYTSDSGVKSYAPALEIAQYVRWNLTLRLTYRFYQNNFEEEAVPMFIDGDSITSYSARAYLQWEVQPGIKLNMKLRRYISDQDIKMNTYLLGLEYEI